MSFPYYPNVMDDKIESLQNQHEYLNILRLRHLQWMNDTDDPKTERVHHEIAEFIEQMIDRYHHLLAELQREKETPPPPSEPTAG